jgi:hypothetical protein
MVAQTLLQKHEKTMENGVNSPAESGSLLENTQAIVLIDLGLCGVDGWSCFDMDQNRLGHCQDTR